MDPSRLIVRQTSRTTTCDRRRLDIRNKPVGQVHRCTSPCNNSCNLCSSSCCSRNMITIQTAPSNDDGLTYLQRLQLLLFVPASTAACVTPHTETTTTTTFELHGNKHRIIVMEVPGKHNDHKYDDNQDDHDERVRRPTWLLLPCHLHLMLLAPQMDSATITVLPTRVMLMLIPRTNTLVHGCP